MEGIVDRLKQYRYGILILVLGIGLMLLPNQKTEISAPMAEKTEVVDFSVDLEQILTQIYGVGRVKVMLTQVEGEITVYQEDIDRSSDSVRENTVLVSGDTRQEMGLVRQVIPPKYLGAVIVCQGGDRASVQLSVVEAVSAVTGLTTDRITVLKMK